MDETAREVLAMLPGDAADWPLPDGLLTEIRIRCGQRARLRGTSGESVGPVTDADWLAEAADRLAGHSLYAREDELDEGYLALENGSRAGICGRWTGGRLCDVRSICLRAARERKGCADRLMPLLYDHGRPVSALLLSRPGLGKTTLLRDMARQYSGGTAFGAGVNVAVADERRELSGAGRLDLGPRCDVLDGCGKADALMMLVRTMAPDVIVTDELGRESEADAVREARRGGVAVAASAHAAGLEDARARRVLAALLDERVFERVAVLDGGVGHIAAVYDAAGNKLYDGEDER